jgi:hypothetical protein
VHPLSKQLLCALFSFWTCVLLPYRFTFWRWIFIWQSLAKADTRLLLKCYWPQCIKSHNNLFQEIDLSLIYILYS